MPELQSSIHSERISPSPYANSTSAVCFLVYPVQCCQCGQGPTCGGLSAFIAESSEAPLVDRIFKEFGMADGMKDTRAPEIKAHDSLIYCHQTIGEKFHPALVLDRGPGNTFRPSDILMVQRNNSQLLINRLTII